MNGRELAPPRKGGSDQPTLNSSLSVDVEPTSPTRELISDLIERGEIGSVSARTRSPTAALPLTAGSWGGPFAGRLRQALIRSFSRKAVTAGRVRRSLPSRRSFGRKAVTGRRLPSDQRFCGHCPLCPAPGGRSPFGARACQILRGRLPFRSSR